MMVNALEDLEGPRVCLLVLWEKGSFYVDLR